MHSFVCPCAVSLFQIMVWQLNVCVVARYCGVLFFASTYAHWTIRYHWGIVCSAHLSKVNQQLRRSLLQPFLFLMLQYSSYFRLIRTGAEKQKAAILSLRTVKPAVTVTIFWPWNPLRVGTVREMLIRLSLRSALKSSGPLLVLTRRKKWWELWLRCFEYFCFVLL